MIRLAQAVACLAIISSIPGAAIAQVYKCAGPDGKPAYQGTPCAGGSGQSIELNTHTPTPADRYAAEQRAADEKRFVREIDSQREYNKQLARIEHAKELEAQQKRAEKCAQYLNRAAYLEERSTTWYTERYRNQDQAEARYIRNQHFTECAGSR